MEPIIFWVFATIAVLASLLVVTRKNPIYSALFMLVAFGAIAALFLQLSAPFIAAMYIMVYAGAIMVLFLFVIMLLNLRQEDLAQELDTGTKNIAGLFSFTLFLIFGLVLAGTSFPSPKPIEENFGSVEVIGHKMFNDFILPFELLSLLIIVAIIGAVLLAKKEVEP
ncbi:MAG: NADH-quinone oxidoreductase subunit J [Planctomycetota bacterium]